MTPLAFGLGGIYGRRGRTAQGVNAGSHKLHVVWSNTQRSAAQVVNCQPIWNGADQQLVCKPVRLLGFCRVLGNCEVPIVARNGTSPQPASIRLVYVSPKANRQRIKSRRSEWVAIMPSGSHVVFSAEATPNASCVAIRDVAVRDGLAHTRQYSAPAPTGQRKWQSVL